MNDLPRQKLCEIIEQYDVSVIDDARRCEGLLRDLCGAYPREINVLVGALKQRVPHDLKTSSNTLPLPVLFAQLKKRLADTLALTEEASEWALYSWALALEIITHTDIANLKLSQPKPQTKQQPQTQTQTNNAIPSQLTFSSLGASRRLEEWKHRLIDLTRRNRLLHFNPSKSTLTISAPDMTTIFEHLYDKEKIWKFWIPPAEDNQNSTGKQSKPPRKDELVCSDVGSKQLEKTLKNIYRRAHTDYQERGLRIFYAVFGTLEWQERDTHDRVLSPLIICPVELRRDNATGTYQLRWAEEDLVLNPALVAKLHNDFSFKMPLLPDDLEARELLKFLKSIENKVKANQWTVQTTVHLSMFTFHKLSMYQDLVSNSTRIISHPVIGGLAGEAIDNLQNNKTPDESELDRIQIPEDTFQILDADSSQQQAIQIALHGRNLVLQGPPGTGKSQTIANIIAEFIARGKSVLFVSEKMAALEVVFKRLRDVHLDDFCLELHSHKANKREVVAELKLALDSHLKPTQLPKPADYEKLKRIRQQLNDYVEALHKTRSPLGENVRAVLEKLALLNETPLVKFEYSGIENLDPSQLDEWEQLIHRLQQVWQIVLEGENFPWLNCKEQKFDIQTRAAWINLLQSCNESLHQLKTQAENFAVETGVELPENIMDCEWLAKVGTHLKNNPIPNPNWLNTTELNAIFREAKTYRKFCSDYWDERNALAQTYFESFQYLPDVGQRIENLCVEIAEQTNNKLVNKSLNGRLLIDRGHDVLNFLIATQTFVQDVLRNTESLCKRLGLTVEKVTVKRAIEIAQLAVLCAAERKPEAFWLNTTNLAQLSDFVSRLRPHYEAYNQLRAAYLMQRAKLLERYDEGIFNLDLDVLIERFSGFIYSTPLRYLSSQYYADKGAILRTGRTPTLSANVLNDLLAAREVVRLQKRLIAEAPPQQKWLGGYDRLADTNFHYIEQAIQVATNVLKLAGANTALPHELIKAVSFGSQPSTDLQNIGERIINAARRWQESLNTVSDILPVERMPSTNLPLESSSLVDIGRWADKLKASVSAACDLLHQVLDCCIKPNTFEIATLLADINRRDRLREMAKQIDDESERLRQKFGERYVGVNTSWSEVLTAIDWTNDLRRLFDGHDMTQRFVVIVTDKQLCKERADMTDSLYVSLQNAIAKADELQSHFDTSYFSSQDEQLHSASFDAITEKNNFLITRIDDLASWVEYKRVEDKLEQTGLGKFLEELKSLRPNAEQLSDIFHKSLYHAWYDSISESDACLKDFQGQAHEQAIKDFRAIDEKLVRLAAQTIVEQCDSRRPRGQHFQSADSEISVLRKQAARQRGHLPIRQLFERIPNLLLQLKPCLLMSPLSVSQFLQAEQLKFDLVIFDEASQIFTEDAVGAIYRGSQMVIAGDSRQLPPTDFFRNIDADNDKELSDDDPNMPLMESSADYASVLDECQTINGISVQWLRWHYRSRHESLIAFSNREFYDSKLITFPSAQDKHQSLGVELLYLPDGIYDRGNKRHNLREAGEIADRVFAHFASYPDKSLGVVAFSQAQMIAIEEEIERRRLAYPQYEAFFTDDRLEGFFVKNLENVQGDERDLIIFSVGYGRDAHGNMTMGFGPLNRAGGERRLNVAVTRAREKVILVSSIKATDIKINETSPQGVISLQRYLDYAEHSGAIYSIKHQNIAMNSVADVEDDICYELRKLGYEVVRNVGASEYRIDIGVVDPKDSGKFLLGIECDGTMYSKANTARDRDRLRQQVLERLGWHGRLHRVWIPDWAMKRQIEIRNLESVLIKNQKNIAEKEHDKNESPISVSKQEVLSVSDTKTVTTESIRVERTEISYSDSLQKLSGITTYQVCSLPLSKLRSMESHDPACIQELCRLLNLVVSVESPIHIELATQRLLEAWGKANAGTRIKSAIQDAISINQQSKRLILKDEFLWQYPNDSDTKIIRSPKSNNAASFREIKHIPSEEIHNAMLLIVSHVVGISLDSLISETGKLFGFNRVGIQIKDRLLSESNFLKDKQIIEVKNGLVSLPK